MKETLDSVPNFMEYKMKDENVQAVKKSDSTYKGDRDE